MKKEQRPHMCNVKNDVRNFYDQEKYRHYTKGRGRVLINNIYFQTNLYEKK